MAVNPSAKPLTTPALAASKYIAEREAKRSKGFDIQKHKRYNRYGEGSLVYSGTRLIDGQSLALLSRGNEIEVLPLDDTAARAAKRLKVGDAVSVTADGGIKRVATKKRGRTQ